MSKAKSKFPLPEKKLFHVSISSVEEDAALSNGSPVYREVSIRKEAVIARTANEAISKIKLVKNKYYEEFFTDVSLVSEIDVL